MAFFNSDDDDDDALTHRFGANMLVQWLMKMKLYGNLQAQRYEESFQHAEDDTHPGPTCTPDLSQQVSTYFDNSKFSDVTLKVRSFVYHAHKLILCTWSDAFREMLISSLQKKANPTINSSTMDGPHESEVYTLTESKECAEVFGDFLKFMYTETLELSNKTVYPVFKLAKKYRVEDLSDLCQEFLIEEVSNNGVAAMQSLNKAEEHEMTKLYAHCFRVLETNYEFLPLSSLLDMKPSLFLKLIGSCNLVVSCEIVVLCMAFKWLTAAGREERKKYTEEVISLIRFAHISPADLKMASSTLLTFTPKMYPRFKRLLAKLLPGAFEWKTLAPDNVFCELPYHVQFVSFTRNYVNMRYYIWQTCYQKLVLSSEGTEDLHRRSPEISHVEVHVIGISANNVYKLEENFWTINASTFHDQASKQWGIRYHLKPCPARRIEDANKSYRMVILTALTVSDYTRPIVCTMKGTVPRRDNITVTLSPQLIGLKAKAPTVNVKVSLLIKLRHSTMLNLKLFTPAEIQKQRASTKRQIFHNRFCVKY